MFLTQSRFFIRLFIALAGLGGMSAVLLGAWTSHVLQDQAAILADTATKYLFWHVIPLLGLGLWLSLKAVENPAQIRLPIAAGLLWSLGLFLFCGNLYLKALTGYGGLGFLTPFGGISFAAGWACFFIYAATLKPKTNL